MKEKNKVQFTMTKEQMEQLAPLLEMTEEHEMEGMIVGQAWVEYGEFVFKWMRPAELIEAINEMVDKSSGKVITPAAHWIRK
jgi:hypothetical protein